MGIGERFEFETTGRITYPKHRVSKPDNELEEGDSCNQPGCTGTIENAPVENCSCHISPPCGACMTAGVVCNLCGYEVRNDD